MPKESRRATLQLLGATQAVAESNEPNGEPERRSSRQEVLVLQRHVFDVALGGMALPGEVAQLARAWDVLEDRKRELRGKPKLAPQKVEPKEKRARVIEMDRDEMPLHLTSGVKPAAPPKSDPPPAGPSDPPR